MGKVQLSSKQYFRGMSLLHVAFITGLVLFALIAVFIRRTGMMGEGQSSLNSIFQVVVPVFGLAGIFGGYLMATKLIDKLKDKSDLKEKLSGYRGAFVLMIACLEGPAIFAIIAYLLTSNYLLLGIALLLIIIMITLRPSKEKLASQLNLSAAERAEIDNPEAIVAEMEVKG